LWSQDLLPWGRDIPARANGAAQTALVFLNRYPILGLSGASSGVNGCLFLGDAVWCFDAPGQKGTMLHLGWRPGSQLRGLCSPPPLSWHWRRYGPLELVGIDEDDSIHWTAVDYSDPAHPVLGGGASTPQRSYRAAALVRSGLIAGVYDRGVDWLRHHRHRLLPSSATLLPLGDAIACAMSPPTRELLVICRDSSVVRVPLPS
jgi:hypothetical protein